MYSSRMSLDILLSIFGKGLFARRVKGPIIIAILIGVAMTKNDVLSAIFFFMVPPCYWCFLGGL